MAIHEPGSRPFSDKESADPFTLDFPGSRTMKINVCCLNHPVYDTFVIVAQTVKTSEGSAMLPCLQASKIMNAFRRPKIPGSGHNKQHKHL